ncbi:hypothetical protein A0H76_1955 [Hepatospora eriocheir]|uniref:Reverse transcriptase RNase H-like domain-containing protein n=1 Tax=Hepatospora eriocheir TaxID=1081669 RepID=A0A1X0QG52_9MICR|nr:hypothetical protein A0H76_1955 [Hepatospora eriocheir]
MKEFFAVIKTIEHFRRLIICNQIIIKTDSKNVTYLNNKETSIYHLLRQILNKYDFQIIHINGKTNIVPNFISRNFYIGDKLNNYFIRKENKIF